MHWVSWLGVFGILMCPLVAWMQHVDHPWFRLFHGALVALAIVCLIFRRRSSEQLENHK